MSHQHDIVATISSCTLKPNQFTIYQEPSGSPSTLSLQMTTSRHQNYKNVSCTSNMRCLIKDDRRLYSHVQDTPKTLCIIWPCLGGFPLLLISISIPTKLSPMSRGGDDVVACCHYNEVSCIVVDVITPKKMPRPSKMR